MFGETLYSRKCEFSKQFDWTCMPLLYSGFVAVIISNADIMFTDLTIRTQNCKPKHFSHVIYTSWVWNLVYLVCMLHSAMNELFQELTGSIYNTNIETIWWESGPTCSLSCFSKSCHAIMLLLVSCQNKRCGKCIHSTKKFLRHENWILFFYKETMFWGRACWL
jgi:hypothetical protein